MTEPRRGAAVSHGAGAQRPAAPDGVPGGLLAAVVGDPAGVG
jgi:hypothetical protein